MLLVRAAKPLRPAYPRSGSSTKSACRCQAGAADDQIPSAMDRSAPSPNRHTLPQRQSGNRGRATKAWSTTTVTSFSQRNERGTEEAAWPATTKPTDDRGCPLHQDRGRRGAHRRPCKKSSPIEDVTAGLLSTLQQTNFSSHCWNGPWRSRRKPGAPRRPGWTAPPRSS